MSELNKLLTKLRIRGSKGLAVLIDPDQEINSVAKTAQLCRDNAVDLVLVGGSLVSGGILHNTVLEIRKHYSGPVYLFPGNEFMIDEAADGILFLSLLSGRNPEYLVGKHVVAAPMLAASALDVVATAYLLIDGGRETSVSYISNTKPIPADKTDIAVATALAGKLMGMKCLYLDAGSGALRPVPGKMLSGIRKQMDMPMLVGGGIRNPETAAELYGAGADMLVIGNGVEQNSDLISEISRVKQALQKAVEA